MIRAWPSWLVRKKFMGSVGFGAGELDGEVMGMPLVLIEQAVVESVNNFKVLLTCQ